MDTSIRSFFMVASTPPHRKSWRSPTLYQSHTLWTQADKFATMRHL
ncbi:MAG: hypothetical protein QM579_00665 [Desulfovibrio sp.]